MRMKTEQIDVNQNFSQVIRERHSVRNYDPNFKLSREEITELLNDAILAPSASNLQPWRFLVIDDQERKQALHPVAFNQQQILDSSAVIAVLADLDAYKQAETIYGRAVEAGYMTEETKTRFVTNLTTGYAADPNVYREIAKVDGGLVSMQLMLAATAKGYSTVPMGGYNAAQFIELFNLPSNLLPVMLIAVGKAAVPAHPTVRLSVDEVTFWNNVDNN
ncbi:nitroreductase family protein [Paenibacillaceae bacterium]|nr:nitroreductase family protein [Paenibacillaceae bacterium]